MKVRAAAPASIGNCAAGFDVLGHALQGITDVVTATRIDEPGVVRIVAIEGCDAALPRDPDRNTAGRAARALLQTAAADFGVELHIQKGIPLASGMGGSAASAVAAVVASNALLAHERTTAELYSAACAGEAIASGAPHGDNVAPSLLGGLVIAPRRGAPVALPVPDWLHVALVHPHFELATRRSRVVMAAPFALDAVTAQLEALALVVAGCCAGDRETIARGLHDVLAEPRRKQLIPGFDAVKQAALDEQALGASIAGGGPSVFAWFDSRERAERGAAAMRRAFADAALDSDACIAPVCGPGAEVLP